MFDFMTNIRINKIRDNYYTVTANTKRFGKNQIMYEGISYEECMFYIRKNSTIEVPDRTNKYDSYIIKHDIQGHYYLANKINGVISPFVRKRKDDITFELLKL